MDAGLPFCVFGVWIAVQCVWTQERSEFSERVSFGSYFQHVVANRFFSQVNRDMEAAHCYSSLALGWVFV